MRYLEYVSTCLLIVGIHFCMYRTTDLLIPTAEQEIKFNNITVLQNFKQLFKQRT